MRKAGNLLAAAGFCSFLNYTFKDLVSYVFCDLKDTKYDYKKNLFCN